VDQEHAEICRINWPHPALPPPALPRESRLPLSSPSLSVARGRTPRGVWPLFYAPLVKADEIRQEYETDPWTVSQAAKEPALRPLY
jgi:hypothetical protein